MSERPVRIIPDTKYPDLYRLQWEDGSVSVATTDPKPWQEGGHYGFYNKSRANDILQNYDSYVADTEMRGNNGPRSRKNRLASIPTEPAGALKPQEGTHVARLLKTG